MNKSVILTLAVIRKEKKITQIELAQAAGVSQPEISYIENSYISPNQEILKKIAKTLRFKGNPEDLLLPYERYLKEVKV
ncbi:MAG: helix-turn-helix transcriptional regulator [Candidatus Heimdallarchaeaceae archaeon]